MSTQRNTFLPGERLHIRAGATLARWLAAVILVGTTAIHMRPQVAEPSLPRPGAVLVLDVIGEATASTSDQQKPIIADQRLRVGSTISTERMSLVTIVLSNGATLRVGSESELEVEEFGQATILGSPKFAEMKEEPTVSRTRLNLVRGDVTIDVKPLNTARGSSFVLSTLAGTVQSSEGVFHVRVRMSDLGLGICTIEVERGAAQFEPVGGKPMPIVAGRQLALALEIDRATGVVKVSDMPKAPVGGQK